MALEDHLELPWYSATLWIVTTLNQVSIKALGFSPEDREEKRSAHVKYACLQMLACVIWYYIIYAGYVAFAIVVPN